MDLPNLLNKLKHKEEPPRRFVAIEISQATIKTAIWQVFRDDTQLVSIGSLQPWTSNEIEDLVVAVDASLTDALSGLEDEPTEVIFGLPESWVNDTGISGEKKDTVKMICERLSLKPVGFVVTTEAMVRYMADASGSPPSLILLYVTLDEITVTLVSIGKIQGIEIVRRSPSIISDVEEGLTRFPQTDHLPSRMLLYDSLEDLESLKQELIAYDWQAHLPFLHFPKIESLSKDITIKAVALSGGAEVARSLGLAAEVSKAEVEAVEANDPPPKKMVKKEPPLESTELTPVPDIPDLAAAFGFDSTPTANIKPDIPDTPSTIILTDLPASNAEVVPTETPIVHRFNFSFFNSLKQTLSKVGGSVKALFKSRRGRVSNHRHFLFILFGVLVLLAILGGSYYVLPHASVAIDVQTQSADQELKFTLNPKITSPDPNSQIIPATADTLTLEANAGEPTTGTTTIGDFAQGKVAIYNRTQSSKTFPKGTVLKSDNLKFTTLTDVNVASASSKENADFSITYEPAKTEVGAVASVIGSQSNLPQNTKLSVANFGSDSVIATVVSAFTGGSSQVVSAVNKIDKDTLTQKLQSQLTADLTKNLNLKNTPTIKAIAVGAPQTTKTEYSVKVGDAADSLQLNLGQTQQIYTFQLADILTLAPLGSVSVPAGFTLLPNQTGITVVNSAVGADGLASITAKVNFKFAPKLDPQVIISNLKGRRPEATQSYLKSLPGFIQSTSKITPNLPLGLSSYPLLPQNIAVTINSATN